MAKEWKCCVVKFKNFQINVATDGDTLRIRKAGILPAECQLMPVGKGTPRYIDIIEDVAFKMDGITKA